MAKVYLLKYEDFDRLIAAIEKQPTHGMILTPEEQSIYDKVFRFYNYQVRNWIDEVLK